MPDPRSIEDIIAEVREWSKPGSIVWEKDYLKALGYLPNLLSHVDAQKAEIERLTALDADRKRLVDESCKLVEKVVEERDRLRERCEAYKGQVKFGSDVIDRLRAELAARPMLLRSGKFIAASGQTLPWKIDCDAFTSDDWREIVAIAVQMLPPFGSVVGVPRGGLPLAEAIACFAQSGPTLYVDDVWTTGGSMRRVGLTDKDLGFVVFARGPLPANVRALFYTEAATPHLGARPMLRVTEEAVEAAIDAHADGISIDDDFRARLSQEFRAALTAALPHLGAVVPSEEAIARAIRDELTIDWVGQAIERDSIADAARAILALFAAAPTEAAIRAEERETLISLAIEERGRWEGRDGRRHVLTALNCLIATIRSRGATP